jgi:Major tropism determinant N-terminal domain
MATRMQQRRGTAAQWTSANPILNAGEMGWESDTNKFKIGDGTNHWADLDYFIDQSSTVNPAFGSSITFEGATANAFETTLQVTDPTADRTITLPDSTGTVVVADGSGNVTVSGNLTVQGTTTTIDSTTVNVTNSFVFEGATANAYETTLTVAEPTADRTITLPDLTGTVALISDVTSSFNAASALIDAKQDKVSGVSDTEIGYLDGVTSSIQTQLDGKIGLVSGVSNTEIGYLDGVTSSIQTQLNEKRATADDVVLAATKVVVFEGTTDDAYETTLTVTDPTADRTITFPNATGTVVLADASQTLTNKTITSADNTVTITASAVSDFTEAAQDAVGNSVGTGLSYNDTTGAVSVDTTAIQARVADVSDTEIGYLNGVTSAIQTQIDAKAATSHTHSQSDITNLTTDLAAKASLSGATFTGAVTLAADPSSALHAATKQYVDAATAGLNVHQSVRAATTANITLSSAVENGDTLDGVTLATGNRILVKNQTTKSENGVYVVAASGAPSRATDYDSTPEVDAGDFIFIEEGTTNGKTGWIQTNVITTIGTDAIEFTQFSGAGTVTAGTNISVSGNQVSVIAAPTFAGLVTASASGVAFSDGTQTKEAVPSRTSIVQKTDSYTLSSLTERDNLIEMGKATAQTVTIPTNATVAYPVGTSIDILQTGAGQVTIAGAAGVTVNATPGLKLRAQWSSATLFKRATDTWVVMGDLSA